MLYTYIRLFIESLDCENIEKDMLGNFNIYKDVKRIGVLLKCFFFVFFYDLCVYLR